MPLSQFDIVQPEINQEALTLGVTVTPQDINPQPPNLAPNQYDADSYSTPPLPTENVVSQGLIIDQSDNSQIRGQPEFNKPWKPQFNSGCCSTCKNPIPTPTCTTRVQAFTRYSQDSSLATTIVTSGDCPCQNN